jgi:hypothetical protein
MLNLDKIADVLAMAASASSVFLKKKLPALEYTWPLFAGHLNDSV